MTAQRNYAPLDASELVDPDYLGTGAGGGKFLKDDQTWDTPTGGGSVATDAIWDAAGDLAVGSGANTAAKLTKGSDGQVLTVDPATHLLVWATPATGAPTAADYLVGTAQAGLSAEIVVGTTPGGELGNTWASPTVDTTHSGSSHAGVISTHEGLSDPHTGYRLESASILPADLDVSADNTTADATTAHHGLLPKLGGGSSNYLRADGTWAAPSGSGAPASVDYLVGTADGGLSSEIVVGTTPGGELGGTWASPTVDATHSGSAHHDPPGAWTDYTPSLTATTTNPTLGSSVVSGRYKQLDAKTYIVRVKYAVTTGGAYNAGSGAYEFSLPAGLTAAGTLSAVGSFAILDSGTRRYTGTCLVGSGTTKITPCIVEYASSDRTVQHNLPVVWATGDTMELEIVVEVA